MNALWWPDLSRVLLCSAKGGWQELDGLALTRKQVETAIVFEISASIPTYFMWLTTNWRVLHLKTYCYVTKITFLFSYHQIQHRLYARGYYRTRILHSDGLRTDPLHPYGLGPFISRKLPSATLRITIKVKGKAIPLPWGFQEVEAPRFQDNQHMKLVSLTHRPPLPPRKYSCYSFMLEAESTPGPQCGQKDYVNEKFQWHHRESNPRPSGL